MIGPILYVGYSEGTSHHRAEALRSLGARVVEVPCDVPEHGWRRELYRIGHRLRRPRDLVGANREVLRRLSEEPFRLLWVDKGLTISPKTLRRAKSIRPELLAVSYSPDDMFARDLQSEAYLRCMSLYDLHVTTKSFNVAELPTLGARAVFFVDNAYDPETHRPLELTHEERSRFSARVGFVGTYEGERAEALARLATDGIPVTVHGFGWERLRRSEPNLRIRREALRGLDYARAINATEINLGFLRKAYRDLQTTRSIEIPACGGFMLAERTVEHLRLFEEGKEAEFFSSYDELLAKCRHYLVHADERRRIAQSGRLRCVRSGYSNHERLADVIRHVEECFVAGHRPATGSEAPAPASQRQLIPPKGGTR